MDGLYLINLVVFLYVVIYGIALGIGNMATRIIAIISLRSVRQTTLGGILDAIWITAIIYFWLWQPKFIDSLIDKIVW